MKLKPTGASASQPSEEGANAHELPASLYCPYSGKILNDPVALPDGLTYDRTACVEWLRGYGAVSPVTGGALVPGPKNLPRRTQVEALVAAARRGSLKQEDIVCSITAEIMREPALTDSGMMYEAAAAAAWKKTCFPLTCPLTREPMTYLVPDLCMRRLLTELAAEGSPLHEAVVTKSSKALQVALRDAHDLTVRAKNGDTPLHTAVWLGNSPAIATMLQHSQAPTALEAPDATGATPLQVAARNQCPELLQVLLAAGANPNAQDNKGRAALHEAAAARHEACVRVLLGAPRINVRILDNDCVDPRQMAIVGMGEPGACYELLHAAALQR